MKHSRRKGFQVIKDRLTYGRKAPLHTSKRERRHGRDITWTLLGMPAPEWVVENWPGSATVIAVAQSGPHPVRVLFQPLAQAAVSLQNLQ